MNTQPDLLLGVDAGTSVVKTALFDRAGNELAVVRRRTALLTPEPAWSETNMEETWVMTGTAIREVLAAADVGGERIAAVGLTGTMVGAWLIDAAGQPVRNAILWNDGRAQPLIDRLSVEHPGFMATLYRTSGSVMQQGCTLPLLRWLAEHEPQALERAAAVLCCKDWICCKLTGTVQLDPTEASVLPGDTRGRGYSEALIDLFGLRPFRHLFPPVRPSTAVAGAVTRRSGGDDRAAAGDAGDRGRRRRAGLGHRPGRGGAGRGLHAAGHQHPQLPGDGRAALRAGGRGAAVLPAGGALAAGHGERVGHDEPGLVRRPVLRGGA